MKNILPNESIFKDTMVEMTCEEVKKEAEKDTVVLFPISVIEEHGPHMDLGPDIYLANVNCKLIQHNLNIIGIRSIIAPPYYWGINKVTGKFPGSFTVKPETFKAVLSDTIECLKSWGFTKIFTTNFHGDPLQTSTLDSAINEIRSNLKIDVYNLATLINIVRLDKIPEFPSDRPDSFKPEIHAGAFEISLLLPYYPDKINLKLAKTLKPQNNFEPLGYVGDPANYDLVNGQEIMNTHGKLGALMIEAFLKGDFK